jgi:uncharacterized protein DUF4340
MNENVKTAVYVGVAALFGLVAWWTLPRGSSVTGNEIVGQPLFPKFDDTSKAASLEITWYDDALSLVKSFKVAKVGGRWVVPSHENYPADAEKQLQDSAKSLFELRCLDIASQVAEEHELFGVVEPPQESGGTTKKGIGRLVALQDDKGDDLVRMVVGKEVDQSPGHRFVRIAESGGNLTDYVYVAKVDLDKLPTDFGKWIERDLLKLDPNDVAQLTLKDYSIVRTRNQFGATENRVQLKMNSTVSWDALQGSWNLDRFQLYDDRQRPHDAPLAEGEELAKAKLDDLKNALDDLKIESVDRKPEGLGADLSLDQKLMANQEAVESLAEHGFFAGSSREGQLELFSRNGEVITDCKDGVRYVLRFGDVASVQEGAGLDKLNRYLLVTAQVADELLPPPVLEPEPAGPATTEPAKDGAEKSATGASGGACQAEDAKQQDASKNEKAPQEKTKADDKPAAKPDVPAPPKTQPTLDPAQVRREQIKKENERKLKDHEEKKKKAQGRVAELNARFAQWYYVISEDTYKKIHLGRSDIIQEGSTAKETGFGIDAFRKLESDGLKKSPPPGSGSGSGGFGGFAPPPGAP